MDSLELIARTICAGCDEYPNHQRDARGNDYRWQDYMTVAVMVLDAIHGTPCEQIRHQQEMEAITAERDRLLVLATKHCDKTHRDWQEILRIAGKDKEAV